MGTQEIDAMGGKAIKYIGNTSHPAPFALDCYGKIKDGAYYNGLRCYEDTIIGFHNFGISPTCTHIANNLESPQADMQFGISPNPASGVLFVQVSVAGAIVVVYDIHGRKLHQQTSTDKQTLSYDTRRYAPGLYVFTLEKDGRVLDKRKVLFVE